MAISLPFTFSNGSVADANQVNSNFNALLGGVNQVQTIPNNALMVGGPNGPVALPITFQSTFGTGGQYTAAAFQYPIVGETTFVCGVFQQTPQYAQAFAIALANLNYGIWFAPDGNASIDRSWYVGENLTVIGTASKTGGGNWGTYSDHRLKRDVQPYQRSLEDLCKLAPISFCYNGKGGTVDDGKRYAGLAAEDVEKHFPEMIIHKMVTMEPTRRQDLPPDTDVLMLDASDLPFALLNAVKQLKSEIDELKQQRGA